MFYIYYYYFEKLSNKHIIIKISNIVKIKILKKLKNSMITTYCFLLIIIYTATPNAIMH